MKNKPQDVRGPRDEHRQQRASPKTKAVSGRRKKPVHAGLANESRPGLGTRNDDPDPAHLPNGQSREARQRGRPKATIHGYEEPRPEPREQSSDPLTSEEERSTGVSGHMGNT